MPILQLNMRSQDIDGNNLVANDGLIAKKTFRLNRNFKFKFLKMLHLYTNISSENIINGGESANTILFCRISFLGESNAVLYESEHILNGSGNVIGNETIGNGGYLCLGKSVDNMNTIDFRDIYKTLHNNAKNPIVINQPFTIELFKLKDVSDDSIVVAESGITAANLEDYNKLESHRIVPITQGEFRGNLDNIGQFITFIFEFEEDDKK